MKRKNRKRTLSRDDCLDALRRAVHITNRESDGGTRHEYYLEGSSAELAACADAIINGLYSRMNRDICERNGQRLKFLESLKKIHDLVSSSDFQRYLEASVGAGVVCADVFIQLKSIRSEPTPDRIEHWVRSRPKGWSAAKARRAVEERLKKKPVNTRYPAFGKQLIHNDDTISINSTLEDGQIDGGVLTLVEIAA